MSNTIKLEDIQPGDKVRITREVTVAGTTTGAFRSIKGSDRKSYFADDAEIELLERPVDLPTTVGTVVDVETPHLPEERGRYGRWMLTQNGWGTTVWVSRTSTTLETERFKAFLGQQGRKFSVVA